MWIYELIFVTDGRGALRPPTHRHRHCLEEKGQAVGNGPRPESDTDLGVICCLRDTSRH